MGTCNSEQLILVDDKDNPTGTCEKQEAHLKGLLHRAFSIFLFNDSHELLIQRRHADKYHSAGLWSNTCCSHPAPGESTTDAAARRLKEEMGIECLIEEVFIFHYHARLEESGLTENEIDHVFVGRYNGEALFHPEEIEEVRWVGREELLQEMNGNPGGFTVWFRMIIARVYEYMEGRDVPGNSGLS